MRWEFEKNLWEQSWKPEPSDKDKEDKKDKEDTGLIREVIQMQLHIKTFGNPNQGIALRV